MAKAQTKPRRGRPPKAAEAMLAPITIRFPQAMLQAIDEIADLRMDQPERTSVIRELIAEALEARAKKRR